MKKALLAVLISTASVAALAVPAGASSKTKSDWTRLVIPCRNGHKSAVIGYSPTHPWWLPDPNVDGGGVLNPHRWAGWYSNPCKGQWLVFYTWGGDPSEDSHTVWSAERGMSGKTPGAMYGRLADSPVCDAGGSDAYVLQKPGRPSPCATS